MATGVATFSRLADGTRVHEALVDALVADGWKRAGLSAWLREQTRRELAEMVAGLGPDEERPSNDTLLACSDWAQIHQALGRRIPDAWRVVQEGEADGWRRPIVVIELAEVIVTHAMSADKWGQYADLWTAGDTAEHCAVRIYGVDPTGAMFPLVADIGGYFEALCRADIVGYAA